MKKGISLIVLIVTIIVIIILAAAVIITVGKNNPVESAREAKFKEDIQTFRDDLALSISKDYTVHAGQRDYKFSGITYEEIVEYIPSFTKEYGGKLIVKDDELIGGDKLTEKETNWIIDLGIKSTNLLTAFDINKDPKNYYGKKVEFVPNNKCSVGWKIFYSDSKNVFLIADDYISVDMLPINKSGHKPKKRKLLKSCKF